MRMAEEQGPKKPADPGRPPGESVSIKKILIVDDEETVRESLGDFLEFHDFAVTKADSAAQALEIFAKDEFDLIISDLVMPHMDGIALIKAVRDMGRDVPLLVMTGFASIEYAVESMKAGATDFITKPLKYDHVMLIINRVLETCSLRKMAQERQYYKDLSNSDGLTKISNYRHFNHVLQLEIDRQRRYHRPLTLLIVDIDDFKKTNDRFGHLIGDMVLIKIATLLTAEIRGFDFVARYGGDEFTVILPEASEREAVAVGRRIMKAIGLYEFRSPEQKDIGLISVTIGVASFPKDAANGQELIAKADRAMYAGKSAGKNCLCVFDDEPNIIRLRKPTPQAVPPKK
jgi:two-component system cell cycle response regulator